MEEALYSHEYPPPLSKETLVIVISGPSGVGKDAVLTRLKESVYSLNHVVTITTRQSRPQEKDGIDYHFISRNEFQDLIKRRELLEWANVYGNYYGVPEKPVSDSLANGRDVLLKVDVQGAATLKKTISGAILIFLVSPSVEELGKRLKRRSTESASDMAMRTNIATEELQQLSIFDYMVINEEGQIDRAVEDIKAIIRAEKCRIKG